MLVKTFQAEEMSEALRLVKAEMGLDAMILSTKKERKKGVFGMFSKPYFEVTAALEPPRAERANPYREQPVQRERELSTKEEFQNSMLVPLARELKELRARVEAMSRESAAPVAAAKPAEAEQKPSERQDIDELKRLLLNAVAEKEARGPKPVVFPTMAPHTPTVSEAAPAVKKEADQAQQQARLLGEQQETVRAELKAELDAAQLRMQQADALAQEQARLLCERQERLEEELSAALAARSEALECAARESARQQEEKAQLEAQLVEARQALAQVEEQVALQAARGVSHEEQAAQLEAQLDGARQELARAQEQVAAHQAASSSREEQAAQLEAQLEEARQALQQARADAAAHLDASASRSEETAQLEAQLSAAREQLEAIAGEKAQLEAARQAQLAEAREAAEARGTGGHPLLEELAAQLAAEEVGQEAIGLLLKPLRAAAQEGASLEELRAQLAERFGALVKCAGSLRMKKNAPRALALVGPTGVGKTTTIAKLAAMHALTRGAKVALITTDNFRVGAIEQLKTYAKIMDLPLEVVVTSQELGRALDRHADKDLVLVDTAGRSPKDAERIDELKGYLEGHEGVEICLCISATTRGKEMDDIVAQFGTLPLSKLLFTKTDESESFGSILNAQLRHKLPLSYFTTGQKVPEDIEVATARKLAQLVMKEPAAC